MADEIERLQKLRTQLDEAEEAIGTVLYNSSTWRAQREEQRRRADATARRLVEIREVVGGGGDLVEDVRALKTRCDEAESLVTSWRARDERFRGLERDLEAAKRLAHEETVRANGWKERATGAESELRTAQEAFRREVAARSETIRRERAEWAEEVRRREAAESALAERNQEIDLLKLQAKSAGEARDSLIEQIDAQRDLASSLRAQVATLTHERDSLRAQVESLRGWDGSVWSLVVSEQRQHAAWRAAAVQEIIDRLPSPSPKTGRWKCRRCGAEHAITPSSPAAGALVANIGEWFWVDEYKEWRHRCESGIGSPADRIDAVPEVTP